MSDLKKIHVHNDIKKAHTIDSSFYTEEYFFNLSINKIFNDSWQYVMHKDDAGNVLQHPFFFLKDTINEPLVLTFNDKNVTCISNICTHRGNIICQHSNTDKLLKCGYHGRLFELSGKFKSMPGFKKVEDFPSENDNLKELHILDWKNFIFTSLKNNKNANYDFFKHMNDNLYWYPFEELEFSNESSNEYIIDAHWAIYCENFLEGFHVPYVHSGLNENIEFSTYNTELFENGVLQFTYSKSDKKTFKNINECPKSMNNIYAYYYWYFPNIMFNYYSWGLSVNIIEPINKNKTRINFLSFPIKGNKQPTNNSDSLDVVEYEDQQIIQQVHKGINSKFYSKGRYSPDYEKGIHHFHKLLCDKLN